MAKNQYLNNLTKEIEEYGYYSKNNCLFLRIRECDPYFSWTSGKVLGCKESSEMHIHGGGGYIYSNQDGGVHGHIDPVSSTTTKHIDFFIKNKNGEFPFKFRNLSMQIRDGHDVSVININSSDRSYCLGLKNHTTNRFTLFNTGETYIENLNLKPPKLGTEKGNRKFYKRIYLRPIQFIFGAVGLVMLYDYLKESFPDFFIFKYFESNTITGRIGDFITNRIDINDLFSKIMAFIELHSETIKPIAEKVYSISLKIENFMNKVEVFLSNFDFLDNIAPYTPVIITSIFILFILFIPHIRVSKATKKYKKEAYKLYTTLRQLLYHF